MVLESTFICVDNSEFMRNGDFTPNRLHAQQEAASLVAQTKLRSNPESNIGLLALANLDVLSTLTTDSRKVLAKLHSIQTSGQINFIQGVKIAHLALKHRQSKNNRPRIVVFVGSPLLADMVAGQGMHVDVQPKMAEAKAATRADLESQLVKLAKKLKKEKVSVDIVSFGEDVDNADLLEKFVETVSQSGSSQASHLVSIPPGPHLVDALVSSPVIQSEDGSGPSIVSGVAGSGGTGGQSGFEFGIDPDDDPELALALRVSMEEERARQQQRESAAAAPTETVATVVETSGGEAGSVATPADGQQSEQAAHPVTQDQLSAMSEEEQIAYALCMSMAAPEEAAAAKEDGGPMEEVEQNAEVENLLSNLEGVKKDEAKKEESK